jgi:aminopeptidase
MGRTCSMARSFWSRPRSASRSRHENASSHIALGNGFPFLIEDDDRARGNVSAHHIDFMIGSAELDVDGVTADGERVSVLRNLAWQL